ncbi:hypothetical protein IGS68_06265 [Skermanella sp. TT6]|uniref:Uncharacterized protein n=1 Tax=Skermanella cutis TaxID=2775420 RepID=A0ABX7BEG3_9PROT|nr:hypothetical protein [Skermanella sp. TT6]QQP90827.1 hypothetical protein IGS68_06265 [Skermanella sp. TT6]
MGFRNSVQTSLKAALLGAGLAAMSAAAAHAQPRVDTPPDWPCVQVFVPTLSAATIWAGPPVDDYLKAWPENREIASLATRAVSRAVPDDEANAAVDRFAEGIQGDRNETLTLLFAGVFDEANRTRSRAVDAIRKFDRAQKGMLANMTKTVGELDKARAAEPRDEARIRELGEQLAWQRRIIEERHRSLGALCEQPVIVERRVGQLARTIANHME